MRPVRPFLQITLLLLLVFVPTAGALAQGGGYSLAEIGELTGTIASPEATSPACVYSTQFNVYLCPEQPTNPAPDPAGAGRLAAHIQGGGNVLLIPESSNDRVMTFDPITGALLDADFIPSDPTNLGTPINAIINASGDGVLVSDQIGDVVHEYTLAGGYVGTFAPAGGANTAVLNNIRGISLRNASTLLVSSADAGTPDYVPEFDGAGALIGPFIASGSGGLNSPFDIYSRGTDWLVPSIDTDNLLRYDNSGNFLDVFATGLTFGEQVAQAANGNVLVANFSAPEGIYEYLPDGTLVGTYDPPGLSGYRGVYELGNGNLLVTTGAGVHEITRSNTLVETEIGSVSARFIELWEPPGATPTPTATPEPTATATPAPTVTATVVTSIEMGTFSDDNAGASPAFGWMVLLGGLTLLGVGLLRRR